MGLRPLVGVVGPAGSRRQPVHRLGDEALELRIVIGAAIGGEDSLMLALGGRRRRDRRTVGLDDGTWRRRRGGGLEPAHVAAGGEHKTCAQQDGRSPKAAAHRSLAPSRKLNHVSYSYFSCELIPAEQFHLPHPEHFDSWPLARLDPAADTNFSIFEGLRYNPGGLECRDYAP